MLFGLVITFIAAVFAETGLSVGKHEVAEHKESIYSLAFLNLLWATAFFFAYGLITPGVFVLDPASFPTLFTRIVFEILFAYLFVKAITLADRSTFGFLSVWTIPFLLVTDLGLGYAVSLGQEVGILVIVMGFLVLHINHGIKSVGARYAIGSAMVAVVTISLYKFDISHYNSVVGEQSVVFFCIAVFYFLMARFVAKENPLRLMRNPVIFVQSLASGVAQVFFSFALLFGPASVMITAKRSLTVLTSIVSGNLYFKEKHLGVKLVAFSLMTVGLVLLAL